MFDQAWLAGPVLARERRWDVNVRGHGRDCDARSRVGRSRLSRLNDALTWLLPAARPGYGAGNRFVQRSYSRELASCSCLFGQPELSAPELVLGQDAHSPLVRPAASSFAGLNLSSASNGR